MKAKTKERKNEYRAFEKKERNIKKRDKSREFLRKEGKSKDKK